MFTNDGYALLIGVDDYSTFDASRSQAVGTSDLRGSRNDVRTFWRLCRLIGIKPAHIRVLASPEIDFNELEGATPDNVALATEAEIVSKAGWLAEMLGQTSQPTGILTYSGHGDWIAGHGLVLCPSDATWAPDSAGVASLDHTVSFHTLNAHLAAHAENLTVVLDTCHSGPDESTPHKAAAHRTGKPLGLTRRPLSHLGANGHAPEIEDLAGRVLAAARRDQVAYQSMFDGRYRGVFSWAVSAAIEQWRATQEPHNVRVDLSYAKLVETAQRLISALWFDQTPELHGPAGIAALAVLHHGLVGHPSEISELPNGGFKTAQIDPGGKDYLLYTLTDVYGSLVGRVLVTATAGAGYDADREYWYMTSNISNASAITISGGTSQYWSSPPSGLGTLSFKLARTPTWTSNSSTGSMLVYTSSLTGEYAAINWQMSNVNGAWTGKIIWWHSSTSNILGENISWTFSPTSTRGTYYRYISEPL